MLDYCQHQIEDFAKLGEMHHRSLTVVLLCLFLRLWWHVWWMSIPLFLLCQLLEAVMMESRGFLCVAMIITSVRDNESILLLLLLLLVFGLPVGVFSTFTFSLPNLQQLLVKQIHKISSSAFWTYEKMCSIVHSTSSTWICGP